MIHLFKTEVTKMITKEGLLISQVRENAESVIHYYLPSNTTPAVAGGVCGSVQFREKANVECKVMVGEP